MTHPHTPRMGYPENRRQDAGVRKRSIAPPVECGALAPLFGGRGLPRPPRPGTPRRDTAAICVAGKKGNTAGRMPALQEHRAEWRKHRQASSPGTIYRAPTKRFASRPPVAPASCRRISGASSKTKSPPRRRRYKRIAPNGRRGAKDACPFADSAQGKRARLIPQARLLHEFPSLESGDIAEAQIKPLAVAPFRREPLVPI